jgi:hypothetical protein
MNIDSFLKKFGNNSWESKYPILKDVMVVPELFSKEECDEMIIQYNKSSKKERLMARNRLIFHSIKLATWLWKRIGPIYKFDCITDEYGDEWQAYGLNERFRLVKYDKNDSFNVHEDGYYEESHDKRSFATVMIYLNNVDNELGGSTNFIDHSIKLQPREGLGIIFLVDGIMHEGSTLKGGNKYILRTDIMYKATKMKNENMKKKIFDAYVEANEYDQNCGDNDDKDSSTMDKWNHYFELRFEYKNYIS